MRKKLLVIAASACLALNSCSVIIVAGAQQCGNCGKMTLHNYTTYDEWFLTGQQRDKKQWNLSDDIYERTIMKRNVIKGYRCFGCGYDYIDSISTDSKILEKYENIR